MINYNELNIDNLYKLAKETQTNGANTNNVNALAEQFKAYLSMDYDFSEDTTKTKTIFDSVLDIIIVEMLLNNESVLLNYFRVNNKYVYYINTAINKRAKSLGINLVNENSSLLNEQLLFYIIANSRKIPSEIQDTINDKINKIKEDEDAKQHIVTKIKKLKNEKGELNQDVYCAVKKVLKSNAYWLISTLLKICIVFSLLVNIKLSTDITTYDNTNGLQSTTEYINLLFDDSRTYVVKYEPWVSDGKEFEREYVAYDVSELNYDDLADYLLLDLERFNLNETTLTENKDTLDETDLYDESYMGVVQISNQD